MKIIAFAGALLFGALLPCSAFAGPDRVSVLLGSDHLGASRDYQELNPGIILTWERGLNYSAGLYYNSYKKASALAAIGYGYEIRHDFEIGIFAGVAFYPGDGERFRHAVGDLVPLVGLQARYRHVFAQLLPRAADSVDAILTVGLTFELQ